MAVNDYIVNTYGALTILGVSTVLGDVVQATSATGGSLVGNIRGPQGESGGGGGSGDFLPLIGGTLTGTLEVQGNRSSPSQTSPADRKIRCYEQNFGWQSTMSSSGFDVSQNSTTYAALTALAVDFSWSNYNARLSARGLSVHNLNYLDQVEYGTEITPFHIEIGNLAKKFRFTIEDGVLKVQKSTDWGSSWTAATWNSAGYFQ
jgi:hypothetical protein